MNRLTASSSAIVSFPGVGLPTPRGTWKILVSGFLLSNPTSLSLRQRMLVKMLGGLMRATPEEMASPILQQRILPFLSEGESRRRICVQLGGLTLTLSKATKKNGYFQELLSVDAFQLADQVMTDLNGHNSIPLQVSVEDQPEICSRGVVHLLPPHGISVISDIDDTIKDSGVVDRRELLVNTFLREFRTIDGMAEVYRQWSDRGASFHYVSSSPWQLFQPLAELKNRNQFPTGTIHLKNFRFRDQFFQRIRLKRHGKSSTIRFLAKNLPQRQFILVGDSGEKDPEIYAKICKKFPQQVKAIFIRELPQKLLSDERRELMRGVEENCLFRIFQTAAQLRSFAEPLF